MFKLVVDSALEEVVFAFDPMDEALTLIVTSGCFCDAFVIVGIKKCRKKFLAVFFGRLALSDSIFLDGCFPLRAVFFTFSSSLKREMRLVKIRPVIKHD